MRVAKNLLILSFLWASSSAFAGMMGAVCEGQDVTVPCIATSWGLEAHALYLQASENGPQVLPNIQTSSASLNFAQNTQWHWGFQIGGTYAWGTGSDFVWNWYNFRNSNNKTELESPVYLGTVITNQHFEEFYDTVNQLKIDEMNFTKSIQWDQVNLEFGQNIDLSSTIHVRPHADFQIARIANFMVENAAGSSLERGAFRYGQNWTSSYTGVGARVGGELAYADENGFGFYAQAATGLLAGPSKSHLYHQDASLPAINIYSTSATPVVANFDAKLGSRLQLEMAQGLFSFELGWMWNAYTKPLTVYGTYDSPQRTDFSIQGFYFGLKWLGSIA